MNKVAKSFRLDPLILADVEKYALENNLTFTQSLNTILASFFAQHNNDSEKYLKLIFQNLIKGMK